MPKEKPILFSGPMVRATLEGRKCQIRSVIKPQPISCCGGIPEKLSKDRFHVENIKCPYGQPGDRLWVRETFHQHDDWLYFYKADEILSQCLIQSWTPSIHMPRKASRITLEITNIRVERVQETSTTDAVSEGIFNDPNAYRTEPPLPYPIATFKHLWDSIYAKRGYGWDVNPWVWVIEFKVVE